MSYPPFNPWQNQPSGLGSPGSSVQDMLLRQQQMRMEQQRIDSKAKGMMYDVGRLVAMRRNSMGLSHGQLAELSRVPDFEIRQLEFGNFDYMAAQKIFRIMAALRLELNVFPF